MRKHNALKTRLPELLLPLIFLFGSCGVLQQDHHPTLNWLDEQLPEADSTVASLALGIAILPVTLPAGLVDTFIANPILVAPNAWRSTDDLVWANPQGTLFYQSALFLPKVVFTPVVFAFTWSTHIMLGE
ncbi:MAG: hypothetical protein HN405_02170 [Planctomycetes bacterium]|jgi:hypothetical protein|nr:hypothetical protein [Planctomycetota bacterium]MBT4029219.1 hypothetical protein [Planctomycetota bacterium]MBT4559300.1 hypothetical protein [Planctomycetota bacterium]MBT5101117.1 hypothetical protein [Planctomycetota bacterium]MBT7013233.1 hypothetical protein [Planctomycetota bacterium]